MMCYVCTPSAHVLFVQNTHTMKDSTALARYFSERNHVSSIFEPIRHTFHFKNSTICKSFKEFSPLLRTRSRKNLCTKTKVVVRLSFSEACERGRRLIEFGATPGATEREGRLTCVSLPQRTRYTLQRIKIIREKNIAPFKIRRNGGWPSNFTQFCDRELYLWYSIIMIFIIKRYPSGY